MNNLEKERRITCLVPSRKLPNEQAFLDLDFKFKVIPNSDLCLATLPEGWKSVAGKDLWLNLIDEKGRQRGHYIYEPDCNNFMDLKTRFYISLQYDPDDSTKSLLYFFIKDRVNQKILLGERCGSKDTIQQNRLSKKCEDFLTTHYPDWENPTKYWDLAEDVIQYWC